jgi:hypothetical protein
MLPKSKKFVLAVGQLRILPDYWEAIQDGIQRGLR